MTNHSIQQIARVDNDFAGTTTTTFRVARLHPSFPSPLTSGMYTLFATADGVDQLVHPDGRIEDLSFPNTSEVGRDITAWLVANA